MKDQLALLRELQNIDLSLDELQGQKSNIQVHLDENREVIGRLGDELEHQRGELDEIRKMQRAKDGDLKEIQDSLKERKKRLLNVGSTKEYNAVEKEIEVLQKSCEQTEEELLHLGEVISDTERSITTKQGMIASLRDGLSQEESSAEQKLVDFDTQIKALQSRANEARSQVSKRIVYKYDFIRSRRPGTAIVSARDGHCEGCFMSLPPQQYIQVQRGETLETCPSCQRILYYWEEAPASSPGAQAAAALAEA